MMAPTKLWDDLLFLYGGFVQNGIVVLGHVADDLLDLFDGRFVHDEFCFCIDR